MFSMIFEKLQNSILPSIEIGATGYLDQMPWSKPVCGEDESRRAFFALPVRLVETVDSNRSDNPHLPRPSTRTGMVVFFQRYSSDPDIWVTANSHVAGNSPTIVEHGLLRNPDNGDLEDIIFRALNGETVTCEYGKGYDAGTKFSYTWRILTENELKEEMLKIQVQQEKQNAGKSASA
jgi:hypothetical protein